LTSSGKVGNLLIRIESLIKKSLMKLAFEAKGHFYKVEKVDWKGKT
jgi:hypothetical protein